MMMVSQSEMKRNVFNKSVLLGDLLSCCVILLVFSWALFKNEAFVM